MTDPLPAGPPEIHIHELPDPVLAIVLSRCLRPGHPGHLSSRSFWDPGHPDGSGPVGSDDESARIRLADDVVSVLPAIVVCKRWRHVVFTQDVVTHVEALVPVGLPPSVRVLETALYCSQITDDKIRDFATALVSGTEYTQQICGHESAGLVELREFHPFQYSEGAIEPPDDDSADLGTPNRAIEVLKLLAPHLAQLPSLHKLDLFGPTDLGLAGSGCLVELLPAVPQLRDLSLSHLRVGSAGAMVLERFLPSLTRLTKINLSANELGSKGVAAIARALSDHSALRELVLNHTESNEESVSALATQAAALPGLASLHLMNNGMRHLEARALALQLPRFPALRILNLQRNEIGEQGARVLIPMLARVSTLETLDLQGAGVGDTGAQALARYVGEMTALRHLDLSSNFVNLDGIADLTRALGALGERCSLESLDLANNKVGHQGAVAISKHMRTLTSLRWLRLSGSGVTPQGDARIRKWLTSLTSLDSWGFAQWPGYLSLAF